MEKDNISKSIHLFVKELKIPITRHSIDNELDKHPDYNSILAISDLFNNWNVPNAAYNLSLDELISNQIPIPFIAYISKEGGGFVLIKYLDEKKVILSNHKWDNHQLSIEQFKNIYGGSVLIAKKEPDSGEPDYPLKRREEIISKLRIPFVLFSGAFILISFFLLHPSITIGYTWQITLLILFKTIGLITSVLLLVQSIDSNNSLIQKICGNNDQGCNTILSSKAAKISKEISWSEVGFFYFIGTWFFALFNSGNISLIQLLAILNIVSLPYTFYSIYYQWFIAKQWCKLCCTIQALLWLEFFVLFPYLLQPIHFPNPQEWSNFIIAMAIPMLMWIFIKPYFVRANQVQSLKNQLSKFKYNTFLFNKLLNEEVKYALPKAEHSIILGNHNAEHTITMVSNPFCPSCAEAHTYLEKWLSKRDDIKLQLIFSTRNDKEGLKAKVVTHFLSLKLSKNEETLRNALRSWYEQRSRNYNIWFKLYPILNYALIPDIIEVQKKWCDNVNINSTPTFFINGQALPHNYKPEDIKYFI
jgi:uncharacterized membrane protein/glutaredoxin